MEEVPLIRGRRLISCLLIAFSSLIFTCQAVFVEEIEVEIFPNTVEIYTLPDNFPTADQSISISTTNPAGYIVKFSTARATNSLISQDDSSLTIPTFSLPSGATMVPANNTGYGYGLNYNWYTATAGNGVRDDGGRGNYTRYWSANALDIDKSYRFGMTGNSVTPMNTWNKWNAFAVRCIKI